MKENLHTFTCTARRDGDHWLAVCDQDPSVRSRVTNLGQAVWDQRQTLALVRRVPESRVTVEVHPVLPDVVREHLARAGELRDTAMRANRDAAIERSAAARILAAELRLSLRDIGTILGVSHQRTHQLLTWGGER